VVELALATILCRFTDHLLKAGGKFLPSISGVDDNACKFFARIF
jgi:hypothetical protein